MLYEVNKKITKELSEFLKTYTTGSERADIDESNGKKAIAHAIVLRQRTVTENNESVVKDLIKKASENRQAKEIVLLPVHKQVIKELKNEPV